MRRPRKANNTLIATSFPPTDRVRVRAHVRSASNAGLRWGALAGGIPLLLNSRAGYVGLLLANATTFVLAATIIGRVPPVGVPPRPAAGPRVVSLRDRPFLTFALVDGLVAALYNEVLSLALPLWLLACAPAPPTPVGRRGPAWSPSGR